MPSWASCASRHRPHFLDVAAITSRPCVLLVVLFMRARAVVLLSARARLGKDCERSGKARARSVARGRRLARKGTGGRAPTGSATVRGFEPDSARALLSRCFPSAVKLCFLSTSLISKHKHSTSLQRPPHCTYPAHAHRRGTSASAQWSDR